MLGWAKQFNIFCFLDNQQYAIEPHNYECLLAAGAASFTETSDVKQLDSFFEQHSSKWFFGHLSYDLKSSLHFSSQKENRIGFPGSYFFVPQFVFIIKTNELVIIADNPDEVYQAIKQQSLIEEEEAFILTIQQGLTREKYVEKIKSLQAHILKGDCYEINFCQEFFSEAATIDPFVVFQRLMDVSPNPFSAFYRLQDKYLLCASPERFLQKQKNKIIAQPIKGTIKRDRNKTEDDRLKEELRNSQKDQSENVMIVDLVRNDLAKICENESVKVDELFGIYSYPQVHQMISTISGELRNEIKFSEILRACFPMGSMTGAPKYRVMQLIDEYEEQSRGIFSGSVGYINPNGDFDFNVVIRSIMYNATQKYLSYQVGGGITFYSDPEKEWEECLLKAEAINKVLGLIS
jgi:para-aminobenzoate synthetase component I